MIEKNKTTKNKHFESACIGEESPGSRETTARTIYRRAYRSLFAQLTEHKEEVITVLNAWKKFEESCVAEPENERVHRVDEVLKKMPQVLNRKHFVYESRRRGVNMRE